MRKICASIIAILLFSFSAMGQVRMGGSLIVWIVSRHSDYVVMGAESRNIGTTEKNKVEGIVDNRVCKVISLGRDTLFFETGANILKPNTGKPWSSVAGAFTAYQSSPKHDAGSLATEWANIAIGWFSRRPDKDLLSAAASNGSLVSCGFAAAASNGDLSVNSMQVVFNSGNRTLNVQRDIQVGGQIGIAGVAGDLVRFFFSKAGTDQVAKDAMVDVDFVRRAIKFAIDNATGHEKMALGGDIDIAIIRSNKKIEWISRKPWCAKEDQQAKHSKRK